MDTAEKYFGKHRLLHLILRRVLPLISEFYGQAEKGKDAPGYLNEWLLKGKGLQIDPFIFETGWHDIGDRASYIKANQHYGGDTWTGRNVVVEDSKHRSARLPRWGRIGHPVRLEIVPIPSCLLILSATWDDCMNGHDKLLA